MADLTEHDRLADEERRALAAFEHPYGFRHAHLGLARSLFPPVGDWVLVPRRWVYLWREGMRYGAVPPGPICTRDYVCECGRLTEDPTVAPYHFIAVARADWDLATAGDAPRYEVRGPRLDMTVTRVHDDLSIEYVMRPPMGCRCAAAGRLTKPAGAARSARPGARA